VAVGGSGGVVGEVRLSLGEVMPLAVRSMAVSRFWPSPSTIPPLGFAANLLPSLMPLLLALEV